MLAGLGMVVMAGWYADSATLVRLHASWAPMPFNEALCFAVLGAALIAGACGLRLVCAFCGDDGGFVCEAHRASHACSEDDEAFLPVVNSPRMGVCAYAG